MTDWTPLEHAVETKGVRLVLARFGLPSPWSEFCRALFDIKAIRYLCVDARDPDGSYRRLKPLTAQESVPVVLIERERPRSYWLDQLYAAERLSSVPRLLPADPNTRSVVIGLIAELCAEGGLGWCRRQQMIERLGAPDAPARDQQTGGYLQHKYGGGWVRDAESQCEAIVSLFANRLREQHAAGHSVFVGDELTAVDLAWAAFAALIQPLPEPDCPMTPLWRELYTWTPQSITAADLARLLSHRDRIYRDFLTLPIPTQ